MPTSLLFDPENWGTLLVDANGNIAVASEPYRIAQDVTTAVKLFKGDLWYAVDKGIPYYEQIYGLKPALVVVKDHLETAALSVEGVKTARADIVSFSGRELKAQIIINDDFAVNV